MSRFSLEIYLIHDNVIHKILLPMMPYQEITGLEKLLASVMLLFTDIAIPLLIGNLLKYLKAINFIFLSSKILYRK